jgi:flavin-dependent dehydrogenase
LARCPRKAGLHSIRPDRNVVSVQELEDGALLVTLDGGEELPADIAIAATGYRTDISRIPFVAAGNVSDRQLLG